MSCQVEHENVLYLHFWVMVNTSALTDLFNVAKMKFMLIFEPLDMQFLHLIAPATNNIEKTHNTLKYAYKAKWIEIHATSNRVRTIFCGGDLLNLIMLLGFNCASNHVLVRYFLVLHGSV